LDEEYSMKGLKGEQRAKGGKRKEERRRVKFYLRQGLRTHVEEKE
jgi:hypothetical protein